MLAFLVALLAWRQLFKLGAFLLLVLLLIGALSGSGFFALPGVVVALLGSLFVAARLNR